MRSLKQMSFITSQSLCEEPAVRIPVAQEPASDLNRLFWTRSLMRVLGKLLAGLSKVMTRDSSADHSFCLFSHVVLTAWASLTWLKCPCDMLSDFTVTVREIEGLSEIETAVISYIILEVIYQNFFHILFIKCEPLLSSSYR